MSTTDWFQLWKAQGYQSEKEMWESYYINGGLSVEELAKLFRVGRATICRRLQLHQIVRRSRGGPNNVKATKKEQEDATLHNEPDSGIGKVGDEE